MNHEQPNYPDIQETAVELTADTQMETIEGNERESRKRRLGSKLWKAANMLLFPASMASILASNKEVVHAIGDGISYAAENTPPGATAMMVVGGAVAVGHTMLRKRIAREEQTQQNPQEIQE